MATPSSAARAGSRVAHPGLRHPLMGARLSTLVSAWRRNGFVSSRFWPLALAMLGSAVARVPLGAVEAALFRRRRRRGPPMPTPVFIIGHWRSGTTHLHNLMSRSPHFGHISPLASGLPDQLLTLATWMRPALERALPEDRHVDRVAVTPDSPQEDEIPLASQQPLSIFHAVYFPRRFEAEAARGIFFDGCSDRDVARWSQTMQRFLEKVSIHQGGRPILVKNPVYTARIARLRSIWPEARFVHIHRNPYEVFASTLHYYRRMWADLALQPFDHVALEPFVIDTYRRLYARFDEDVRDVPADRLADVAFEDLEADPVEVLRSVYDRLDLEGWSDTQPRVEAYLSELGAYRRNRFDYPPALVERVGDAWGDYVKRWGYSPPAGSDGGRP